MSATPRSVLRRRLPAVAVLALAVVGCIAWIQLPVIAPLWVLGHGGTPERRARAYAALPPGALSGRSADLSGLDLARSSWKELDLRGLRLTGSGLAGADLHGALANGVSFSGARLDGASLDYAQLVGADLAGIGFQGGSAREANLTRAVLDGADLRQARM
jgi:hypothetical protein